MEYLKIERILASPRRGSSRPVMADTPEGKHLVKLRGAAQGTGVLIAELVVGALARTLSLPVLHPRLAELRADTPTHDKEDELADLLAASSGLNLAVPLLMGARDADAQAYLQFTPEEQARILWLDRFVMNPDRTQRNPNILQHNGQLYLIDHGSALRFQYGWQDVTEQMPGEVGITREPHIFEAMSAGEFWNEVDEECTRLISRIVLDAAINAVPASFLLPMLPQGLTLPEQDEALRRRRAAYTAFLWKRLKLPRSFVTASPLRPVTTSGPPAWLKSR